MAEIEDVGVPNKEAVTPSEVDAVVEANGHVAGKLLPRAGRRSRDLVHETVEGLEVEAAPPQTLRAWSRTMAKGMPMSRRAD